MGVEFLLRVLVWNVFFLKNIPHHVGCVTPALRGAESIAPLLDTGLAKASMLWEDHVEDLCTSASKELFFIEEQDAVYSWGSQGHEDETLDIHVSPETLPSLSLESLYRSLGYLMECVLTTQLSPFQNHFLLYSNFTVMDVSETYLLGYPTWKKIWMNRKGDLVSLLFQSPVVQVEDSIKLQEYYAVVLCLIVGGGYILYKVWEAQCHTALHFDTMHIIPEPANGRWLNAVEMGVRVLLGDQTYPTTCCEGLKDQLLSCWRPVVYCFTLALILLSCCWQCRPNVATTLLFWMTLGVVSRLVQAFHLNRPAVKRLLHHFIRPQVRVLQHQARVEPTLYATTAATHLKQSPMEKFQIACQSAQAISPRHYLHVALFFCMMAIFIHISRNLQRILAVNFEESYMTTTLFRSITTRPYFSVFIDLMAHSICLYISLMVYKIPMLHILMTRTQSKAASFFTQNFPFIDSYAYPMRCFPKDPHETLYLWNTERCQFFQRMNRQMLLVRGPSDAFYTGFFLVLATMLFVSGHTNFFLYNEYGLCIAIAALATSLVLLVLVWEGERTYRIIHHQQETVFWDWWSGTGLTSLDHHVLTRPHSCYYGMSPTLSCAGVPIGQNATILTVISLLWIWVKILCESYSYEIKSLTTHV